MDISIALFEPPQSSSHTRFHFDKLTSDSASQPLAKTRGHFFINAAAPAFNHELERAVNRNLRRLDTHFRDFWHTKNIRVGHTAFCEVVPNATNTSPNTNCTVSAQIVQDTHSSFIFTRGIKEITGNIEQYQHIAFFSCFCLFGSQALRVYSPDGTHIDLVHPKKETLEQIGRFEYDSRPSFYELESAIRQTELIADLAGVLPAHMPYDVLLEFPREHYYFYLLGAWQQGLLSKDKLLEWIALVDERYNQVVTLQRRFLNLRLGSFPPQATTRVSTLEAIRPTIVRAIEKDNDILPEKLVAELAEAHTTWQLAKEVFMPATFHELQNFSYTVDMLTHSLRLKTETPQLLAVVENHIESKTFGEAQHIANKIIAKHPQYRFDAIGFYPRERAFTANELGRSSLYWFDPGHDLYNTETNTLCSSMEVLAELYGLLPKYFYPIAGW